MPNPRPDDLPDFESPPVVETVLSVQFEPLSGLRTAHLGLLWKEFQKEFPRTDERQPLDRVVERFPGPSKKPLELRVQTLEKPLVPRLWFLNGQGNEMIQVQSDRFIKNWRKEGEGEQYPRYESVKASFVRDLEVFQKFLDHCGLPHIVITQCEVTYVNHILSGEGWSQWSDFGKIFPVWKPPPDPIPGSPEDLRMNARFVIPDTEGRPAGRLYTDIQPALRKTDNRAMYVFHLTARGQIGNSLEFFDVGRRWIVHSFTALTTPQMHEIWKRRH